MLEILKELRSVSDQTLGNLNEAIAEKDMNNPLPYRLEILLKESNDHASYAIDAESHSKEQLKYHLEVLYKNAEMINEMYNMLQKTESINLVTQINELKNNLTNLIPYIVELYGKYRSLYIVTPLFQQLSGLWP